MILSGAGEQPRKLLAHSALARAQNFAGHAPDYPAAVAMARAIIAEA